MPQMVIPDFMPQIVWLCIVFPLIYISMKYFALPRITNIMTMREEKIRNDINKAEEIKNKIEQTNNELQLVVESTNNEIKKIVKEIHIKNQKDVEKKITSSQKLLDEKLSKNKSDIETKIKSFQRHIDIISVGTTENVLEKLSYKLHDLSIIKGVVEIEKERLKDE